VLGDVAVTGCEELGPGAVCAGGEVHAEFFQGDAFGRVQAAALRGVADPLEAGAGERRSRRSWPPAAGHGPAPAAASVR
jgi:hypothetical protein